MSYEKLEVTRGLMEAYSTMYVPEEKVENLNEAQKPSSLFNFKSPEAKKSVSDVYAQQMDRTFQAGGGTKSLLGGGGLVGTYQRGIKRQADARAKSTPVAPTRPAGSTPVAPTRPAGSTRPAATAKPPVSKVAPTTAGQTGDKAKDMATWAKANPKLAAAAAERERTRGTSATTNPQMAGLKDRLPAPKAPSPTSGSASVKPVSSAAATAATTKPVDTTTPAQAKVAAAPKPVTMGSKKPGSTFEEVELDTFDIVLEYLISSGHAQTISEAEYIMTNIDSEMIDSIVEAKYGTSAGRKELAAKIRKGQNIGKKGPGTGFKAVEKAAEKGGAENPKAVAAAAMWKTYGGKKEE